MCCLVTGLKGRRVRSCGSACGSASGPFLGSSAGILEMQASKHKYQQLREKDRSLEVRARKFQAGDCIMRKKSELKPGESVDEAAG